MATWLEQITNVEKKTQSEAFNDIPKHYRVVEREANMPLVKAKRGYSADKVNYALRIERHIDEKLSKCDGSKNAVINALLEFALLELEKQNKSLLAE